MVIPNTFITNDYCQDIRKYFLENSKIVKLNNEGLIFKGAVVEALIFVCIKQPPTENHAVETKYNDIIHSVKQNFFKTTFLNRFLIHIDNFQINVLEKIKYDTKPLNEMCEVWRGLTTGNDKKYLSNKKLDNNYRKIIQGKQISRYYIEEKELYVNYLPNELDRARPQAIFEKDEKIVSKFVGKDLSFAYDAQKLYVINTACVIFNKENIEIDILYILSILNSKLMNYYFKELYTDYRDTFPIIKSGHLELIPIKLVNKDNKAEIVIYTNLVNCAIQLTTNKSYLVTSKTDKDKTFYESKCNTLDRQIDRLVYELYGLTEEEVKIVEGE